MAPTPEPQNAVCMTPTPWIQAGDSSAGHKLHRVGQQRDRRMELFHSPGPCPLKGSALPKKDGVCYVEKDSAQHWDPVGYCFTSLSLEPQISVSPHMTLAHSAFPPPEPRVSGCKGDFLCWPFKRAPKSLALSCIFLVVRIPADSHSQMLCDASSQL